MVKFTGRSKDIISIKSKPIPVGFKIYALADAGFVYSFLFCLGGRHTAENAIDITRIYGLTYQPPEDTPLSLTSRAVVQLVLALTKLPGPYTLFLDNFFTNICLLSVLRRLGIGTYGIIRLNYREYLLQHAEVAKRGY
jgi:hypothetical protein